MPNRLVINFSQALVDLAKERDILDGIYSASQELVIALKVPELPKFLSHPKVPVQGKREMLLRLIPLGSPVEFINFLNLIIDRHREGLLLSILESVLDLVLKAKGFEIVELVSACPLTSSDQTEIKKSLEQSWQVKVALKYRENPNLIGGMIISHGDQWIDGSLAGQIRLLKESLLKETVIPGMI